MARISRPSRVSSSHPTLAMQKLLAAIGAFAGSSLGWALGAHLSLFTAVVLSAVGTGVGIYYGRKLARDYF